MNRNGTRRRPGPEPWDVRLRRLYGGGLGKGARFGLFTLMLTLIALTGGSSWPNAWQLLLLRPGVVLLATAILVLPGPVARPPFRTLWLLLAAFALAMAVQLVPLPPGWWHALPGHALFGEAAGAAGTGQPWRPITLSADLTLNSLVALSVPAAVLLGGNALRADQRAATAGLAVGVAVLSAFVGLLQLTLGSSFYLYTPTTYGRPVGLFANINHQAAVLAAAVPMATAWAVAQRGHRGQVPVRAVLGAAAAVLLLATALVTGSRGGLLLSALAIMSVPLVIGDRVRLSRRMRRLATAGIVVTAAALALATWGAGRLGALDRLLGSAADQRVTFLPITTGLLHDYAPFGSGFGTFDAVFRQVEPDAVLKLTYFNHAHNDLLELGITGGLAAVAVVAAYLLWLIRRGVAAFGAGRREPTAALARAGLCAAALLLLASLADYPLRTPLAGAMLALASLWAADRQVLEENPAPEHPAPHGPVPEGPNPE